MFNCNGVDWNIQLVNAGSKYLKRADGTQTIGMTDGIRHTIYLNKNLRGKLFEKVLTHELCHAICFSYDIILSNEVEELLAQWVATYGREVVNILDDLLRITKARA